MKKIFTHWTISLLTLAILTFIGLNDPYLKQILRLKSFDYLHQYETKEISQDIGIVTIDEKSIEANGQWPWDRRILADLVLKLREAQVGIIVMPILFSEYDRMGGDETFINTINQMGVVVAQVGTTQINKNAVPRGVAKIGDPLPWLYEWPGMLGPIPELGQYADGVGVINTAPEIDGVVRRIPLIMRIGEETYPAMALETIRVATGDPSYQIKATEGGVVAVRVPGYDTIETDQHARIWLRWNKDYNTLSASSQDFSEFSGKTVIIALTAEGLSSIVATPLGEKYDYVLSASTLQTVLDGKQINRYDYSLFLELIISLFIGMSIVILTRFTPYWFVGAYIILLYISLIYVSYFLFTEYLILADASWSIFVLTIVGMHSIFNRFVLEFQLKQQIRKQFETYLDPRQVAILQKDPSKLILGGDRREMSFLFMDIIGFTPISEYYKNKDDPEGLVKLVNEFLDDMTKILLNNGAMIDKFMGDCIMAVFNAPIDMPDHAERAVKSAIEIEAKTKELKALYKERGLPDINVGTGINTGTAIIGNMGSSNRFDYSVIGDAVNLAARLEATAGRGEYKDCPTLYSSYTQEKLENIKSVEVDKIKVKGKEELITIFKPV
jgi:adenylate cyclase